MLSAGLTPPPRLIDKYYISQDSIDFRVILSLSCLGVLCLTQSVSSYFFLLLHRVSSGACYPYRFLFVQSCFPARFRVREHFSTATVEISVAT